MALLLRLSLMQEPVTVKLGDSGDIRESGIDTFQYIPLLPGLNSLLQNPYIFEEVYHYTCVVLSTNYHN